MDRLPLLFAFSLLPIGAAFAQPAADIKPSQIAHRSSCSAAAAYRLIGETRTPETEAQALALSGATSLRVVRFGGTRDLGLVNMRLTVAVDAQQRIAELKCE